MDPKALRRHEKRIYEEARKLLKSEVSAPSFSETFFAPGGRLAAIATSPARRRKLVQSALYRWLQQRLVELRRTEASTFDQQVDRLSGRLTLVVPRSLHAALKHEAQHEGVSLSELMRLKLSIPYRSMVQLLDEGARRHAIIG